MLLLGCEDLMSLFTTGAHGGNNLKILEFHILDVCPATIARNIFILMKICTPNFHLNSSVDLDYLWDVMYNATWPESTQKRFSEDVKNLRDSPLPHNIIIPGSFHDELKSLFTGWLAMTESLSVEHFLADR